jgi:hypothetical protein
VIALIRRYLAPGLRTIARVRWHRVLGRIERELGKGDPHLRQMFAIFAGLTGDERATGPEPLPRGRGVWRRPAALAVVIPLLALGLVIGLVGALAPGQASACPARAYVGAGASGPGSVGCR